MKTSANLRFSNVFREVKKGKFAWKLRKRKFAWNELSESFPSYMNNLSSKKKVSQEKY